MVSKIRRLRHDLEMRVRKLLKMKKRGFRFSEPYPGPFQDGLWGEVERTLAYHSRDVPPLETLNRLVKKQAHLLGFRHPERNDETTAIVTCETWPIERLAQLPRMHDRDRPRDEDYPILIYQTAEIKAIIDGHTRVNKWTKRGKSRMHRVLVICPRVFAEN